MLLVNKLDYAIPVSEVVNRKSLGKHVFPDAAHLNRVWRKEPATIHEGVSFISNWVVSFVHYEHSYESFVSVHDEVTAEFVHVFLFSN